MQPIVENRNIANLLAQSQNIIIVTHQNPDGDALGSSLGLHKILTNIGKTVSVILPNQAPDYLNWLPNISHTINYELNTELAQSLFDSCDLVIMVDFNTNKRVKEMEKSLSQCRATKLMIDHHPYPDTSAADYIITDTSVSSTCELLLETIIESNLSSHIDTDSATCIYTGIITDTGALSHNSNQPKTYQAVANLLSYNINKEQIHQYLFHSNSANRMRLLGYVLHQKMKLITSIRTASISLTQAELDQFNYQPGDTEGFVNYPLGIDGIDISGFFIERDGIVKISLRSRGTYPVNKLSEMLFNGGGHLNAAGGETTMSIAEAERKFLEAVPSLSN